MIDDEHLDMLSLACLDGGGPGGPNDAAWREQVADYVRQISRLCREVPRGHEPAPPAGPVQAFLEVVTPAEVRRLISELRNEQRLRKQAQKRIETLLRDTGEAT